MKKIFCLLLLAFCLSVKGQTYYNYTIGFHYYLGAIVTNGVPRDYYQWESLIIDHVNNDTVQGQMPVRAPDFSSACDSVQSWVDPYTGQKPYQTIPMTFKVIFKQ